MNNEMINNIEENKYIIISNEEASKIIDTREPLGLFLIDGKDTLTGKYVAIDNTTGDAWTEEFLTEEEAINWLINDCIDELNAPEIEEEYSITLEELLRKVVKVTAHSEDEALDKVMELYKKGDIVLDSENHVNTDICIDIDNIDNRYVI